MTAKERAEQWLSFNIDQNFKQDIEELLAGPSAELEDAFYKGLEFGTGGMRGVMGTGSNRVNRYTFGMATQGLANYLRKCFGDESLRVAIAYDCRNNSQNFAKLAAEILSANGITVYLFEDLRPTPELSFAVRQLKCHSGIVITASHNPPEYNGYKVYWNDGAQVVAPHDKGIIAEVDKVDNPNKINFNAQPELIKSLGKETDDAFIQASLANRKTKTTKKDLGIVFTSLHGTSITLMPELLKRAGYQNVHIVEEQATPDGDFPTVESPNPEERAALDKALVLADKVGADCVIGTDPDSDRIGVAIRDNEGKMVLLNGNQTGVVLTDYLLGHTAFKGNEFIAYTIVSSDLLGDVASQYGVESKVCLTGFKYIAKLISDHEGEKQFIGGGEESYGYMVGDFVRDKDALTSALIFCDWLGETLSEGMTAEDYLNGIYKRHGLYHESLLSITKKGKSGSEEIARMMDQFRSTPPATLGNQTIIKVADYKSGVLTNIQNGNEERIDLPPSNVLQFYTAQGGKISVRPSGTEPKIKFYFSLRQDWDLSLSRKEQQKILEEEVNTIIEDLNIS